MTQSQPVQLLTRIVLEVFSFFENISRAYLKIIILVLIQVPKIKIRKILWRTNPFFLGNPVYDHVFLASSKERKAMVFWHFQRAEKLNIELWSQKLGTNQRHRRAIRRGNLIMREIIEKTTIKLSANIHELARFDISISWNIRNVQNIACHNKQA